MKRMVSSNGGFLPDFCECLNTYFHVLADFSDQASAVLSGSDEKNCNDFVKRQALYSCLTCAPEDAKTDFSKSIGNKKKTS